MKISKKKNFPTVLFADKIYSRGITTETENSINSAVRYSNALLFINKFKNDLIDFSIDKIDSLNYLSKIKDIIFLSKKTIRNTKFFSQAFN